MRVRSLKQVLHWLFLVIGIISVIVLSISVNSYISYAKEGYGLECKMDSARIISDNWLRLRLFIENPGGLDIVLEGGNLTLGGDKMYEILNISVSSPTVFISQKTHPLSDLPMRKNTSVVIWFQIGDDDYTQIASTGLADIYLDMGIFVPERFARTHLVFESTVEVNT